MSPRSFPVAWHTDGHRFVGKAYVDGGDLFLSGSEIGIRRRRRDLRIPGSDLGDVSTHRVAGLPGLVVEVPGRPLEIELLSGSWGAARELAEAIVAVSGIPKAKNGAHPDVLSLPRPDDSWWLKNHRTPYQEVWP